MSPRNQVPALNSFCSRMISNWLIHALSDEEGRYVANVEKYLAGCTYEVLQDLLKIILNSVHLDASIRYNCLEVLLREDVKKLETGMFPQFYYKNILQTIRVKGTRLQVLDLKGVWVRDYPELLTEVIKQLTSLKSLIVPHMADDNVIDAISSLKHLIVLDICGDACFTSNGIRRFKSDVLQVLYLGNFGKLNVCEEEGGGTELVAEILGNLPNLTQLKIYSFVGKALNIVSKENKRLKTKLRYLHDTGTSRDVMEVIRVSCEELESLHFDTPEKGVVEKLSLLPKLNTLKLTKLNVEELLRFLRNSGDRLQTLKLNHNKNETLDVSEICFNAPNLQSLECFQMKLSYLNSDAYFMSLATVEMLYCELPDNVIKSILTNAPFLRRIVVASETFLTDGDVFRICAETDFDCLEEIWFSCARCLTATSIELLMGHCPNLRVIGQLNGWDVNQDEIDYLRVVIALTNTNLALYTQANVE